MSDLEKAKSFLADGEYSCAAVKGDTVYTGKKGGIVPLLEFISSGTDLKRFSAADKIIGKAAALLWVLCGVKEVYTPVLSEKAASVFKENGISFTYDILVSDIFNKAKTDICPMEKAVCDINDTYVAYEVLTDTLARLRAGKGKA